MALNRCLSKLSIKINVFILFILCCYKDKFGDVNGEKNVASFLTRYYVDLFFFNTAMMCCSKIQLLLSFPDYVGAS